MRLKLEISLEKLESIINRIANKEMTLTEAAKESGVTRPFLTRRITRYLNLPTTSPILRLKYTTAIVSNKTGKSIEETEKYQERKLTKQEIESAKDDILSGRQSLRKIAKSYGRSRDYIKNRILSSLSESEQEEFLEALRENGIQEGTNDLKYFNSLGSIEEKQQIIFDKLNERRENLGKNKYSISSLKRKYKELVEFFTHTRPNSLVEEIEESRLSENDVLQMLFNMPTLLSSSIQNRIVPAISNLDQNDCIGPANTTRIIKEDASILLSSISRTNLQIRILRDYNWLDVFLKKPKNFRTSPELIYSIIQMDLHENKQGREMLTRRQIREKFGYTENELEKKYNIRDKYKGDEYFEK